MPRIEDFEAAIGDPVQTIAEQTPAAMTPEPAPLPEAPQFEAAIDTMRAQQKQAVQGSLFVGQKSDPERRAKAIELSKRLHVPADFVERHYDEFAKRAEPTLDVDALVDQNPRVSKYLESIDNAALSHDDLEPLKKIEASHNSFAQYGSDLSLATRTGFRQLESSGYNGAALYGLADPDMLAEKAAESNRIAKALRAQAPDYVTEFHRAWEQPGKTLDEKTRDFRKSIAALADGFTLEKLKNFGKEGSETAQDLAELLYVAAQRPKATSYIIAENLANSLPTLALELAGTVGGAYAGAYTGAAMGAAGGPFVSIAGLVAGAGIGAMAGRGGASFVGNFATEVGGYVNEELEKSGVDITDPAALAAAYKNPALITRIRSEAERKGLTIATTSALFAGLAGKFTAAGKTLPGKVARAGTEIAVGGLEEGAGEYLGDAAAKQSFEEASAANAALEGVAGMGQAAGTVAIGGGFEALSAAAPTEKKGGGTPPSGDPVKAAQEAAAKYVQARQVLDQGESLMQAVEAVRESKTTARMPEKLAELIDGDEPSSHVYFQADAWDAYWVSKGLSPVTIAADLAGDGGQAYQNAKDTGAPLEVSMGQYLAKIAPTEHLEGLFPATRTTPDGLSFQEAKEFDQQLPQLMESIAKEAQGAAAKPEENGTDSGQVAGIGTKNRDGKAARQAAKAIEKQIRDQLVQAGMSPAEAKADAFLTSEFFRVIATREGIDPQELFARYGLNVQGPEQSSAAAPQGEQVMEQPRNIGDDISTRQSPNPLPEAIPVTSLAEDPSFEGLEAKAIRRESLEDAKRRIERGPVTNRAEGWEIQVTSEGLKKAANYATRPEQATGLRNIRSLIENAIYVRSETRGKQPPHDYLYVPFEQGGEQFIAKIVVENLPALGGVRGTAAKRKFYSLHVQKLKRPQEGQTIRLPREGEPSLSSSERSIPLQELFSQINEARETTELFQEGQNEPRGRIRFGRHSVSIDLLKNADRSTFLHETGHLYLEVLGDLATADGASEQLKRDYETALKWFGVTDRKDITTEHHEKWARGFEAYLMEGKAPTPALREAFQRFKTWLIEIYRELRNLNVELTPEIRSVFARLVATEEEIAEAQGGLSPPLFENAEAFGMTGPAAERYRAAIARAKASAEEELTRKAMAELREREGAEYGARRDEVEFQVRAQVDVLPVYRALEKLQDKESGLKVQREGAITTMGFKKLPDSLSRYRGMFTEDGVHPDILAEGFGFENGEQMLNAIANAVPKEDLVEQLTEQRMRALFPSLFDEGRIQAEAEAAVRNEDREKVLRLELQHLASNDLAALKEGVRRVTRRVPPPKAVKAQAARILGGQAVRDIKPALYEKAERAAGKEAGEALARGDFERAFDAKQRELLNNALYRAALAAKETVRKSVADFKKLQGADADIAKSREMDYVNTARAILAAFGLGRKTDKPAESYLAAIERNDNDTYQTVKAIFDSATQRTGQFPAIAFDDFVAMRDAVQALWELAKETRSIEIDGRKVELSEAKAELLARIAEMAPPSDRERPGLDRKIEDKDRRFYGLRGIMSRLRRVESWVDEMDGGKLSGAFRKYLWTPVSEAIGRYRDARKVTLEKYLALVKTLDGLTGKTIAAPELSDGKSFTFKDKAHLLGAMLHTGNLSNKSKLVGGMKWGGTDTEGNVDFQRWDAFVARMQSEGILTKADYDFLQKVWDLFEEQKPEAQKVHKKLYGFYFNEITADEIVTPFGTYRGGYAPAIADSEVVEDQAIREEKNSLEKANNSFMFPTAGRGFTKKRVEQYMAPLVMDLRFVPQQLDRVLRFIHIEPAVKQAARIAMAQDFRKALSTVDPTAGAEMLIPWLQRAAQQMVETPMEGWGGKATAKFFRGMRSRSGMQVMFANVTNTLQQFTGVTIAAVKVKPRHLRNALWSYVRAPGTLAKEAGELSELMRSRMDGQVMEIREQVNELLVDPSKYDQAVKFAQKHVYFLQSATQNVVDVVVWHGAYDQAVEDGLNQQDAIRAADSAVRLTQGSMAPEDISRFETGNAFVRAFTMFYSYFNMQANLLGTEFANTVREMGVKKGTPRLLYIYTMGFLVPAMLSEMLVRAMSGKGIDEDDDDQYMDDVMMDFFVLPQIRNGTAMFPVAGQIANAGINALDNKWYNDRISTSPAISMLETSIGGAFKIGQKVLSGEDINGKRATRDLLTLLGLLSGLPLAPLARPIGYGIDLSTGDAEPTGPIDMTRGFITGKSGTQK